MLKPGGKLFARMASPYSSRINPDIKEKMDKEIKNFIEHRTGRVPGFIPNMREFRMDPSNGETIHARMKSPMQGFVFDKDVTEIVLQSDGFKTELCAYNFADTMKRLLLIAEKPNC